MPNHLIDETSPYLLQHAHNPVDWYPWSDAAFAEAKRRDVPVLLSVGYAACHWCHVMERESFDNHAIAALMNKHFVCIKVDREERLDVDETYMMATQVMNQGRGGWPMTVFLAPEDKAPFFAGTYFPPEDRHGMAGFGRVLQTLADMWGNQRQTLLEQATTLRSMLARPEAPEHKGDVSIDAAHVARALDGWGHSFDGTFGGFSPAPKFPAASTLMCMMQLADTTPHAGITTMVRTTLDGMADGGIRDHVGGGFARYSTDAQWLVPHFEKMLYDNALLAQAYTAGYLTYQAEEYADVARETLTFLARDMQSQEGGFFASFDADSEGEEGKYYVWTPNHVAATLKDPATYALVCAYYDITEAGNWEGVSIPRTLRPLSEVAAEHGLSVAEARTQLAAARKLLLDARAQRVAPGCDDKIITAWNGMAMAAMARGARALGESIWLQHGVRAADFLLKVLRRADDGRLWRTYRAGKPHIDAYLEDYAFACTGLLDLYEAGGPPRLLHAALELAELMVSDFYDPAAEAFFHTSQQHEMLFARRREAHDGATPSATAVAAWVVGRLARHDDRFAHGEDIARAALRRDAASVARAPQAYPTALMAWDWLRRAPVELAFAMPDGAAAANANPWQAFPSLARSALPPCTVAHGTADSHLLLQKRPAQDQRCTLYVCRDRACAPPTTHDLSALP